jgi:chromosomal replication initiation ATPase DnaA
LRLPLDRETSYEREDFVVSACNSAAVEIVDAWPYWPDGRIALVGPEGVGKTHLARAWASKVGAILVDGADSDVSGFNGRPILVENADQRGADDTLFHVINMADSGTTVLITGRTEPVLWPTQIADLRSRFNALHVARIATPDDAVLIGVMSKLFRERNIRPSEDVLTYLAKRIERSVPVAQDIVQRIDDFAAAERREITRATARQILEGHKKTLNLFE